MFRTILSLSIILAYFCGFSQNQHIFKFVVSEKSELDKLTQIISIDKFHKDTVWAYANESEFKEFLKYDYTYEILSHPGTDKVLNMATSVEDMHSWDKYPTYDTYVEMMKSFAEDYPSFCELIEMGTSIQGRKLLTLRITKNVTDNQAKPKFFYTGTMHGDETAGFVILLRFADWLLSSYRVNSEATFLMDNFEIFINPNSNPDGTYRDNNNTISNASRGNSNYVDLNRDFPDPRVGANSPYQPETQIMMEFAQQHSFVMSANFHGGIELANYPWDAWDTSTKQHPDIDWWQAVATDYAETCQTNSPPGYFTGYGGVVNGGDWYVIVGGRQDYMNYWHHCRELTLEISDQKLLSSDLLPAHWDYNFQAMIDYIKEARYGFNGFVTNSSGQSLDAKIEIIGHDQDNTWVKTCPINGDYYRPIAPGTYQVTFSSNGYISQTHEVIVTDPKTTTVKDVILLKEDQENTGKLVGYLRYKDSENTAMSNVEIKLFDEANKLVESRYTNTNGYYEFSGLETGTYFLQPNIQSEWDGVDVQDIIVMKKHIAGITGYELSGINYTAGDVNADGTIDVFDLVAVRNRILGINSGFSGRPDWIFTDRELYVEETINEYDIHVLCAGDVNASYYKNKFQTKPQGM